MNIKSIKYLVYVMLILFYVNSSQAIPLPFPSNISIKDLIKHGKKAIEKNRDDKNAQEEYQKTQGEFNTDVDKKKENLDVLNQKNELRERFNGNWSGELFFKKENQFDISCKTFSRRTLMNFAVVPDRGIIFRNLERSRISANKKEE